MPMTIQFAELCRIALQYVHPKDTNLIRNIRQLLMYQWETTSFNDEDVMRIFRLYVPLSIRRKAGLKYKQNYI